MRSLERSRTFQLGDLRVRRLGYGAMHLSGPGIFGPPRDRGAALAVLREAVAAGVNHIDTSDYYGPHITNQLIREALHPYPDDLVIVTKIGARRGNDGSVLAASSPDELIHSVHDNLRHLDVDVIDVVNLRNMFDDADRAGELIEAGLTVLADLQQQGLVRHIGLSNVTPTQIAAGRRICDIVCVQNRYNLANRSDDELIDRLADDRIAYVPFFPLGGLGTLQSTTLSHVARVFNATTAQVALAWLLRRAPNMLLIPGTSSVTHLRENIAATELNLPDTAVEALGGGASIAH
jgi:pyridoxine 4-dehydrogenase